MRLVLSGGRVIDTEPEPYVRDGVDVLVDDGRIAAVGPDLAATAPDAEVIDTAGKIVMPGLVDTHRHTWQAAIRGTAYDTDFPGYRDRVVFGLAARLTPEDVYAGNLAGARECLAGGVTTLLDWSHIQRTPAHTDAALAGLRDAGIRAVFGYVHPSPGERRPDELRRVLSAAGGPVGVAMAAWGPEFVSMEDTAADWRLARELGLRISVHINGPGPITRLAGAGLLGADTTYVHANGVGDDELRMVADSGGSASITPLTETLLGMGRPEIARLRRYGIPICAGADTVTVVTGDLFAHLRSILSYGRAPTRQAPARPCSPALTSADVLRVATLDGAAALGLADRIGSLRPGKQADIVVLGGIPETPDPVAAVVATATAANVETVLVAGRPLVRDQGHFP